MTSLVIETAVLADAVKKAEKVAPSTGEAFDKAAGILLELDPGSPTPVIVKATNLDIYSMEWIDPVEIEGEPCLWRLPSRLFSSVVSSLPMGSGKQVKLEAVVNGRQFQVHVTCGRTTAKFNMMQSEYFPTWGAFDPSDLSTANDVGARLSQVEWAAAKSEVPMSGVNLTGQFCQATDRYRLARVPLDIPGLESSVTIPSSVLSSLLKQTGEISIGVQGTQLLIQPDEYSQIRAILYGLPFPSLDKPMTREYPNSFTVRKTDILAIMARASGFSDSNRDPLMRCFMGREEFAVMMENNETGLFGDVIDLTGQAAHARHEIRFTPKNIMEPIEHSPSEEVTISYDLNNKLVPVKIDGGSGYIALAMPRKETDPV